MNEWRPTSFWLGFLTGPLLASLAWLLALIAISLG